MLRSLGGWRFVGDVPEPKKAVCLAVPHTTNLDGLLLVLLTKSVGMDVSWMVKASWGKGPFGNVVRGVGGVFIDRAASHGMVEQMIQEFARRETLHLVIPPEGTRSRTDFWKSGFYRIALGAKVPIVPGFLDYRVRQGGFGSPIDLSGNVKQDMDRIRHFYRDVATKARYPNKVGPIRLRDESE